MHAQIDTAIRGLHATEGHPLPFAPSLHVRAFLLQRSHANLLVYGAPGIVDEADEIDSLGGFRHHYLNHWHEAMFVDDTVSDRFESRLVVHEADSAETAKRMTVHATFAGAGKLGAGFELIPTPGHTPGATAYLWENGEHRFLFTGDTIYLRDGEWVAAVLDSSDRDAYLESLERIRELEFDVLVPWGASAGDDYYAVTSKANAQRRIDAIMKRLRRGERS
jgi:hypothetical protein